jgi:hypothetical protein
VTAQRPRFFFSEDGCMPESVKLKLSIPPELGAAVEVLHEISERIESTEERHMSLRSETGKRVLGRRGVLRRSWRDSPTSREPRRQLRPRVAARSKWARLEALRRNREFQKAYRSARLAWLAGLEVTFPAGTYWLHRFAGVPIEAPAN